jgi:DNA-3-methyladenine glycosylase II
VGAPTVTSLTPPRLASLPAERAQLEFSSRSIAFVDDGRRLLRAWGPPERPWVVGIEPAGDRWRVEAWGAGPAAARAAVRSLFSLDHPVERFYALVRQEPILRGTERRFRGLRLPRDASLYEALLHAIVGQQLSVASASALKRRLFERTEARVRAGSFDVPCAPRPSAVVRLGPDGVRELGLSRVKSRALYEIARWAQDQPALPPGLESIPLAGAIRGLSALYGVGRWTAENALLRGAGRTDVFVAGDLAIRVALERFGALPRTAPELAARAWADRVYPAWGSYATLYLWRRLVVESGNGATD